VELGVLTLWVDRRDRHGDGGSRSVGVHDATHGLSDCGGHVIGADHSIGSVSEEMSDRAFGLHLNVGFAQLDLATASRRRRAGNGDHKRDGSNLSRSHGHGMRV
jgi:hypothetical protein